MIMPKQSASGDQPILVLKEDTHRTRGKEAQHGNIMAAMIVAEALKTTLGPRGMDKMLIEPMGDVSVTSDGDDILDKMDIQHPAAKILVEAAENQDKEVGDGTTTLVVLTGELLKKAEELLNEGIHPTIISSGYRKASEKAAEFLNELAEEVDIKDEENLRKVAETALNGRLPDTAKTLFAKLAVEAIKHVADKSGDRYNIDVDDVIIRKKEGGSLQDTALIDGVILAKGGTTEPTTAGCGPGCTWCPPLATGTLTVFGAQVSPKIALAKIALFNSELKVKKTQFTAQLLINKPSQIEAFLDQETRMLQKMVEKIQEVGANVVVCQKSIDEKAKQLLSRAGIFSIENVADSDMVKLVRATSGKIVTSPLNLTSEDLGFALLVEERKVGEDNMVFIEGCDDPKAVTILIRGGSKHVIEDAESALHDALCVVADVFKDNRIVPGGGAVEEEIARRLREYAPMVGGREQLAIEKYAEALETIPKTLAENMGFDSIDILVNLRTAHENGQKRAGVYVYERKVGDTYELGIVEPLFVKAHALKSATETASTILRIDDIIMAKGGK
jgi:chaperonin GroEL (HSP60 family)